jgi:hypothetical protein
MRYMMFIKIDGGDDNFQPTVDDVTAMTRYNEELTKAGALLAGDGLQPPSKGAVITFDAAGRATVVDGPYAEGKEVVGGYWIIQTKSKEEAVEWATRVPGNEATTIELRQMFELSDFPEDVQAAAELSSVPPEQTSDS